MRNSPQALVWSLVCVGTALGGVEDGHAQATHVRVRVVAQDAKIIGASVGGARVIVRHAGTGEIVAEEVQQGGTGDTRSIVVEPVVRGETIYDTPDAGAVTVSLDVAEPTVFGWRTSTSVCAIYGEGVSVCLG